MLYVWIGFSILEVELSPKSQWYWFRSVIVGEANGGEKVVVFVKVKLLEQFV